MAVFPAFFGLILAAAVVTGQEEKVVITPQVAVRRVGEELQVSCKVHHRIDSCRFSVAGKTYFLRPGDNTADISYFAKDGGQQNGECGASIKNILDEWNGNITCFLPPKNGSQELQGTMRLTVAKPPAEVFIVPLQQSSFLENDEVTVECVARESRPAAKLTFSKNDITILENLYQPNVSSMGNTDFETVSQKVRLQLTADDNGKVLACDAEQEATEKPIRRTLNLIVNYPPRVDGISHNAITIFGLKLNQRGVLNVTVRSNPTPRASWRISGSQFDAPHSSPDGLLSAPLPLALGNGYYNVSLILDRITKEDVERTYDLVLANELGAAPTITVRLSNMDEPAGVELDTGAVVGIVIAVLVFLIALSLAVFAFVTDRWCFAGRRRDTTKSSGESSDTESAVGGKERSRLASLGARVRAALPRAKDRVQATEAQPDEDRDKEPEDKVVYAQLALSEQTTADKPLPPSTEYAEIVYTDHGHKEAKE